MPVTLPRHLLLIVDNPAGLLLAEEAFAALGVKST